MTGKGFFITLEGGDGAGKSTQIANLVKSLRDFDIETVQTREPGGCKQAETIRELLVTGEEDRWDACSEVLLHYAARREHLVRTIWPALEKGQWVVSDRFADSTYAYQGYGMGFDFAKIDQIHKSVVGDFAPDLTIILDINPAAAVQRSKGFMSGENRYEAMKMSFHEKLREGFLEIAKANKKRCIVIDASDDTESVRQKIWDIVSVRLLPVR